MLSPMKFGVDYAHNTGNQRYRRRKWNSGIKSFVEEEMLCKTQVINYAQGQHNPREYCSSSWPYWRQSSAYCGLNLSGAWYVYQLWECAVHNQKRAMGACSPSSKMSCCFEKLWPDQYPGCWVINKKLLLFKFLKHCWCAAKRKEMHSFIT